MEAIVDLGALDRARDGDSSAFDALVEARVGSMLRDGDGDHGRRGGGPRRGAGRARQRVARSSGSLRDPGAFDAWLTRILVNRCRRGLRRRGACGLREVAGGGGGGARERSAAATRAGAWSSGEPSSGRSTGCRSTSGRCSCSITSRAARWGRSPTVLGIPVGTAKSRLSAARRSLERALEREEARSRRAAPHRRRPPGDARGAGGSDDARCGTARCWSAARRADPGADRRRKWRGLVPGRSGRSHPTASVDGRSRRRGPSRRWQSPPWSPSRSLGSRAGLERPQPSRGGGRRAGRWSLAVRLPRGPPARLPTSCGRSSRPASWTAGS